MIQRYSIPARWDPFAEMAQLQKVVNRLWGAPNGAADVYPPINVYASDNEAVISAELPGVQADQLDISVRGETVTLSGSREAETDPSKVSFHRQERFSGQFSRSVELPFGVDATKVKAQLRNGVLTLTLPRAEADKPRRIAIENG
jgi:HSP20 family protein